MKKHFSNCLSEKQIRLLQTALDHRCLSDDGLSAILFLSPRTVHNRFQAIFAVFGVHNRLAVLIIALEDGLIWLARERTEKTCSDPS